MIYIFQVGIFDKNSYGWYINLFTKMDILFLDSSNSKYHIFIKTLPPYWFLT